MIFEVSGTYTPDAVPIAGLWRVEPVSPMLEAVSFGLPVDEDVVVWRANLPAKTETAHLKLAEGEVIVAQTEQNLRQAEAKLTQILKADDVDFGIQDWLGGGWKDIAPKVQEIVDRMARLLRQAVQIETKMGGTLVGQTLVSWGGDFDTVWLSRASDEQMVTHYRTLTLALDSHKTYMRRLELVVRSVIRLAMALTNPGMALVSLPASWKLVNEIIDEMGVG